MDDFKELSLLAEHVIDKRGFFYHGDEMEPESFVRTVARGEYNNTSSMYGKGMYCVRHPVDAAENSYGPYIYKLYVRGLDNFLHLDELPYNSAFGLHGTKDSEDFEEYRGPTHYSDGEPGKYNPSYRQTSKGEYGRFVVQQFEKLARTPLTPGDRNHLFRVLGDFSDGNVVHSSEVLYGIYHFCERYGIAGVTYTGAQDRRCCLVYDMRNVFPVAWAEKEYTDEGEDIITEFHRIDYNAFKFSDSRNFISKYDGSRNIERTGEEIPRDSNVRILTSLAKVMIGSETDGRKSRIVTELLCAFMDNCNRMNEFRRKRSPVEREESGEKKSRVFRVSKMLMLGDVNGVVRELTEETNRHFVKCEWMFDDRLAMRKMEFSLDGMFRESENGPQERLLRRICGNSPYLQLLSNKVEKFDPEDFYYGLNISDAGGDIFKDLSNVFRLALLFTPEPKGANSSFNRDEEPAPFNERYAFFTSYVKKAETWFEKWYGDVRAAIEKSGSYGKILLEPYAKMRETALLAIRAFRQNAEGLISDALKKEKSEAKGGGGAPGSTAAEPQTQMESFSGFVGHSVTPGVVSPVPRKILHGF